MSTSSRFRWLKGIFSSGTFLFENAVKRPFLGAVLTTSEQRRWCANKGFSQFGLTNYSVIESFALAIILPGLFLLLGWEVDFGLPGWLATLLSLSKDVALWIGIGLKVVSLLDAASRLTFERFIYPRRPRPGLFLGLARLVFYESPHAILNSRFFRKYLAQGRLLGFLGRRYLRAKQHFQRKFLRMATPELEKSLTPPANSDHEVPAGGEDSTARKHHRPSAC
jgi:hypothetical protein